MVAGVADHFLGAADGQGGLGRDGGRDLLHARIERLAALEHAVHQTDLSRFFGLELAARVGQLARNAVAHQLGQALQRAHVGGHADVDFLDAEVGVGAGVAHVGAGDEVDAAAYAAAVDGGQHGLAAALQAGQRVLHVQDHAAQRLARAAVAVVLDLRAYAHHHLQVDARTEQLALALQHGHSGLGCAIHPLKGLADFLPHGGVHGVGLVGAVQAHGGDVGVQRDAEGFKLHGVSCF